MKKLNNQTVSAHVIIIVILILAVLGLLGFVFWQNFVNKPATSSNTSSATQSAPSNTTKNNKTLIITEWGVKGSYSSDATYGYKIDQYGYLQLTDPSLSTLCASELSYILRATASEVPAIGTGNALTSKEIYDQQASKNGAVKFGDYYYFIFRAQSTCDTEAETVVQGDIYTAESSILASLSKQ